MKMVYYKISNTKEAKNGKIEEKTKDKNLAK